MIGVCKKFGQKTALDDLSLSVRSGEIVALLGPNGSGKTTTMNLVSGLIGADTGSIELFSHSPRSLKARQRMGITLQDIDFPSTLACREVVEYVASSYPDSTHLNKIRSEFDLSSIWNQRASQLSGGQKRKLAFALAFVGTPSLVLLDEPTTGMDLSARALVWQKIRDYRKSGGTVLLTTHHLEEAERLATRILLLKSGKIIMSGSVSEILQSVEVKFVQFQCESHLPAALLEKHSIQSSGGLHTSWTKNSDELVLDIIEHKVEFGDLQIKAASLEEAFVQLTARGDK